MLGTGRSYDESHDRSCDRFPWSHVLEITWLELGLGVVVKQLVIVEWVLGSFGNVFLVGASFARDTHSKWKQHILQDLLLTNTIEGSREGSWTWLGGLSGWHM